MDTMNFVDISSWQIMMNLENLFRDNPELDGAIVKSSGGSGYIQTTCDPWVQTLMKLGKPWGFYHFLDDDYRGAGGAVEARFFVEHCENYFGRGVPIADYEYPAKNHGTGYLKDFLDTVYSLTGVKPMVYCSLSLLYEQDFTDIAASGYPLWIAQYANTATTGIQETPWQKGSVYPFDRYWMHQYSGTGRLNGYKGDLDLDKFYGTKEDWEALVSGTMSSTPVIVRKKVNPEIIRDVLDNKYGTLVERTMKLSQAGYDPTEVQNKINELYLKAEDLRKIRNLAGDYFDLMLRISEN